MTDDRWILKKIWIQKFARTCFMETCERFVIF